MLYHFFYNTFYDKIIIKLAELIFGEELLKNARTLENLGIDGMTPEELLKYVETGERN